MDEGLFAVNIFTRTQGSGSDEGMPMVRRGDADCVDVPAGDDFAEIAVSIDGFGALLGGVKVDDAFPGIFPAGGVDVANGNGLDVIGLADEAADETLTLLAGADEGHADFGIR
jgi:hypothetical protein